MLGPVREVEEPVMVTLEAGAYLSLGEVAARFGLDLWKVQRLFRRRLLPAPPRLGPFRVVREEQLPEIGRALVAAGYLAPPASEQIDAGAEAVKVRVQVDGGYRERAVTQEVSDDVQGDAPLDQPAGAGVA
jgi:hypothetical protein